MNTNKYSKSFSIFRGTLLALCLLIFPMASQAVLINEGDSFRFGIDLADATPSGPYSFITWYVNASPIDGFDSGEILTFSLFDDANSSTALGSGKFDWSNGGFTIYGASSGVYPDPYFDGTGYLEFTMTSGSIDLMTNAGMVLGSNNGVTENGLSYVEILPASSVSVPEPNTLSLVCLALLVVGFFSFIKSRPQTVSLQTTTA